MKIGELAQQAGVPIDTVRYYEREGLLEAPAREPSGYRRYAGKHLARLRFVRHCRSLDIPLAEVRQLIDYADAPRQSCAKVNALLDEHIDHVHRRLLALKALERQLVALRRACGGADSARSCAILESFISASGAQSCACHGEERGRAPTGAATKVIIRRASHKEVIE